MEIHSVPNKKSCEGQPCSRNLNRKRTYGRTCLLLRLTIGTTLWVQVALENISFANQGKLLELKEHWGPQNPALCSQEENRPGDHPPTCDFRRNTLESMKHPRLEKQLNSILTKALEVPQSCFYLGSLPLQLGMLAKISDRHGPWKKCWGFTFLRPAVRWINPEDRIFFTTAAESLYVCKTGIKVNETWHNEPFPHATEVTVMKEKQ